MSMRRRIVLTLDALDLECDGDPNAMQAMVTAEIEKNPQGEFASALQTLGIEPTIAALEKTRDQIVLPFMPRVVGDATAAEVAEGEKREAIREMVAKLVDAGAYRDRQPKVTI